MLLIQLLLSLFISNTSPSFCPPSFTHSFPSKLLHSSLVHSLPQQLPHFPYGFFTLPSFSLSLFPSPHLSKPLYLLHTFSISVTPSCLPESNWPAVGWRRIAGWASSGLLTAPLPSLLLWPSPCVSGRKVRQQAGWAAVKLHCKRRDHLQM